MYILNPTPSKPSTLSPQPYTLNPKPYPKPSTPNPTQGGPHSDPAIPFAFNAFSAYQFAPDSAWHHLGFTQVSKNATVYCCSGLKRYCRYCVWLKWLLCNVVVTKMLLCMIVVALRFRVLATLLYRGSMALH